MEILIVSTNELLNETIIDTLGLVYGEGISLKKATLHLLADAKKKIEEHEKDIDVSDKFAIVGYGASVGYGNAAAYGTLVKY